MERHDTLLIACGTGESRRILRDALTEHYNLLESANAQQTLLLLEQNVHCIAAVLLDITDPENIGREFLEKQTSAELLSQVPVVVIAPDDDPEALREAFEYGATDVIPLGYDPYAMLNRIEHIVELYLHQQHLEVLVAEQADILRHSNDTIVDALSSIIEYRSVESGQHILRIRHFTKLLLDEVARCCPEYELTEQVIHIISSAAALHDVGKIAIPDAILMKPGKLTPEEMDVMKTHTLTGCHMLQRLGNVGNQEYLRYAHNICHYHHERWDGSGYPEGLAGDDIPICAQVVSLADVYDALTNKRVYKEAYSFDTAVNMILNGDCGAFSPKLLECFKHVTDQYEALARAYADGLAPESENFDVELPAPSAPKENDSIARTWAKYQALVHYANAFLMEVDLDQGLFHVVYNPYPELISFQEVKSFPEMERLLLDHLVVPQQREQLRELIHAGIDSFLEDGRRHVNHRFRFRSQGSAEGENFDVTFLRINPNDSQRRTMAVLCRKTDPHPVQPAPELPDPDMVTYLAQATYRCWFDHDFTLIQLGSQTITMAGYTQEEIHSQLGGRLSELIYLPDREMVRREFREQLARGNWVTLEHRVLRKDGQIIWVMNKSCLAVNGEGQEYLHCFLTDITASKRTLDELNRKLERYEIILAQTENVLFEWDLGTDEVAFSDTWETIFGFKPITTDVRKSLLEGSYFHPDDVPLLFDRIGSLENGSPYEMVEVRIATAKGRYLWCRFRATAIRDGAGNLRKISGIIINIDAEKQAEQALQNQAERDSLTKLLNNHAARKQAEEYFNQFAQNVNCALLIIDLDDFKLVNDRYGHLFGDAVLTKAASEIKKLFRNQDIIARIGGDEFMVLMRGVSDRSLVEKRCSRLLSIFHAAFQHQRYQLPLSCSIGIALCPEHGTSYYDLFQRADQALYQAKDQGKNSFMFYSPVGLQPRARTTAISNHIDSDEQPGLANGNIVQYAFQRLYSAKDVEASINDILKMIGQQLNVSRVYVFENSPDNRFCSNTYEWCNAGIPSEIHNLQNVSYETDIPNYEDYFNEEGLFYCPDIAILPQPIFGIVEAQGIKSMLHYAIRDNGVFRGYIGFDECVTQRFWTKEQIGVLTYFSEMLAVFLLKKQAQEKTAQRAVELSSILDNQNAWIYIIDPDSCELKYLNTKTKELAPGVAPGMCCYEALLGRNQRCENCPSRNIRETRTGSTILHNDKFSLDVLAEATLIQWDGQESCLLTCREISMAEDVQKN